MRLPDAFFDKHFRGFIKLGKNLDPLQPPSSMTYMDGYIVIYEDTFYKPHKMERKIIHEFAHHLHELSEKKLFAKYKKFLGWKEQPLVRPGQFLKPDAKSSPEEDFATNFEYYFVEPNTLLSKIPSIHKWFKSNLTTQYKLKDCKP